MIRFQSKLVKKPEDIEKLDNIQLEEGFKVYHGTREQSSNSIRDDGIIVRKNGFYTSKTYEEAAKWAIHQSELQEEEEQGEGDLGVVELKTTKLTEGVKKKFSGLPPEDKDFLIGPSTSDMGDEVVWSEKGAKALIWNKWIVIE